MSVTPRQVIAGLYAAFFNRAPDQEGLSYWEGRAIGSNDLSLYNILAAGFADHPTFTSTYAGTTDQEFVEAIYINALGYAGDSEGISFWINGISNGMSRSDMVASFVYSALTVDLNSSQFNSLSTEEKSAAQNRQDTLTNKAEAGLYFADSMRGSSNITTPNDLENDIAYQWSVEALSNVDNTSASVDASKTFVDEIDLTVPSHGELSLKLYLDSEDSSDNLSYFSASDAQPASSRTNGDDEYNAVPVIFGFGGNDTLTSTGAIGVLLGGSGNDDYVLGSGHYIVYDSNINGKSGTITIPVNFENLDAYTMNRGGHNNIDLVLFSGDFGLLLPDWTTHIFDSYILSDGEYSYNDLFNAVRAENRSESTAYFAEFAGLDESKADAIIDLFVDLGRMDNLDFAREFQRIDVTGVMGTEALIDYLA